MADGKSTLAIPDLLGRAITVYKENFPLLLNFSCAASAPVILRMLLESSADAGLMALGMILGPVAFAVYVFFFLCLVFLASSFMQGQVVTATEAMSFVWARFWRGIGAYCLFGLAVFVGMLLLVVPGVYCFTVLSFFPFIILFEDKGVWSAFKRSDELVKGYFWPVLGANGIILLITFGLFLPLVFGIKMIGFGDAVLSVIMGVVGALIAPAFIMFYYLVYDFLKNEKDGTLNISVRTS